MLSSAVILNTDGSLGLEEKKLISAWLEARLHSYRPDGFRIEWMPGVDEVKRLLTCGISTLKRRYRGSTISASAVVWGWLGRESIAGRVCSNVERPRQGGTSQQLWQWTAMVEGGWLSSTGWSSEAQRKERLLDCVDRCAGVDKTDSGWIIGPRSTWHLMQMLRRHYRTGTEGMDLLSLDVSLIVQQGSFSGDVLRRRVGGGVDHEWWGRVKSMVLEDSTLVSSQSLETLSPLVHNWYKVENNLKLFL